MNKFLIFSAIFLVFFQEIPAQESPTIYMVKINGIANISLPVSANYRRMVLDSNEKLEEHLYRVCNGKNKKTCGYWENVKTKKKVPASVTTYNKKRKVLIVKKMKENEFGMYMTGNKKKSVNVLVQK